MTRPAPNMSKAAKELTRLYPIASDAALDSIEDEIARREQISDDRFYGRVMAALWSLRDEVKQNETVRMMYVDRVYRRILKENETLRTAISGIFRILEDEKKAFNQLPEDARLQMEMLDRAIKFVAKNPERADEAMAKVKSRIEEYQMENGK